LSMNLARSGSASFFNGTWRAIMLRLWSRFFARANGFDLAADYAGAVPALFTFVWAGDATNKSPGTANGQSVRIVFRTQFDLFAIGSPAPSADAIFIRA